MVVLENKSEENAIKTGNITENIDIYSLLWQKMIIFACVCIIHMVCTHPEVTN